MAEEPGDERQLAVDLFNETWSLLDTVERTPEQEERMIHTAHGSRLVAGPFERVIAGLGDREGMRVHRSWWVSRSAVVGVEVDGRNLKLRLSNDLRAPVSRASVAKLRQVGWLPAEP
jgi:DNA-binding LytR/AlgR family response regulator